MQKIQIHQHLPTVFVKAPGKFRLFENHYENWVVDYFKFNKNDNKISVKNNIDILL